MNLSDGTSLFKRLVRAADLNTEIQDPDLDCCLHRCDIHGWCQHWYHIVGEGFRKDPLVCSKCVALSRERSQRGSKGGKIGGVSKSPAKVAQWRAAQEKRHGLTPHTSPVPPLDPSLSRADNARASIRAGCRQVDIARAYGLSRARVSKIAGETRDMKGETRGDGT